MNWRVIALEQHDAYTNMATDHAITEAIANGQAEPTIRFYTWKPSAVSIGCFQSMEQEVNIKHCNELGVDYVRRRTGGGAVYHDTNGEITYSVIAPEKMMPAGIVDSYRLICGWIIDGLKTLGIAADFAPINDIVVGARKISGNAQTRRAGVLLQHGTILYDLDIVTMFSLLKVSKEKISDKQIKSVEERVGKVRDYADVDIQQLYKALLDSFVAGKDYRIDMLSSGEQQRARELATSFYETEQWNFSR